MKIAIIHLSDIHIDSGSNPVFEKTEKICHAIQNFTLGVEGVLLLLTGDIAYSGSSLEYERAKEFIDRISKWINEYSGKKPIVVMVPGNHDCNFAEEKVKTRQIIVKDIKENGDSNIDESVVRNCCEIQSPFFELRDRYMDDDNIVFSDKLVWITEYCFGAFNVICNCYNTSWISELQEKPGTVHFPIKTYSGHQFRRKSDLSISMFHHTLNWLNPTNLRDFSRHLEYTCHVVFTGHEHIAGKTMKDNLEGLRTYFIEGAVLQDESRTGTSGFNILLADLSQEKHRIYQYQWNGSIYKLEHETEWLSYHGQRITNKVLFPVNGDFKARFLNNVGAQIRHPNKTDVFLEDIFVFPYVKDIKSNRRKDKDFFRDVINSESLCKIKEPVNKTLLVGSHGVGKTTLCKIIFRHYHNSNYVPIYVEGNRIKTASIEAFYKVLNKSYLEQYPSDRLEEFTQLDNASKILIIDDFDRSRLNPKTRSILLNNINHHFPNVIITGSDLFPIDEILSEEREKELAIEKYEQYQILEFGHLLRSKLINRWNMLGKEELATEEELIRKHDEAQQVFNTIIGRNYVPAYPIFLLIILQTIEAGRPHDLEESSFGHYYQYLIFDSLDKVIHKSDEIDAYYNFLTDFAYYLFVNRMYEISKDSFYDFHTQYCKDYAVSSSFDEVVNVNMLLGNLINADVIEDKDGIYKFRYPYIFNFFVAKYLTNNLIDENIRQVISNMCKRLYREEFADIVMFLTHHSKDPFILSEILENAKALFPKQVPVKFEDDMTAINKLLKEIPKLVLEDKDISKHREDRLQLRDAKEFSVKSQANQDDREIPDIFEPLKQLDLISELNVTFKTIEILGQILKNYSGSLKRPLKFALAEEAYMLGLRGLTPFFRILEEKKGNLVERIRYIINERKIGVEDIEEESRLILFTIFAVMSYGFIKTISGSVGSERLSPTFKEIVDKRDINSVNLIDVSIKLDFYRRFPYGDLRRVKEKVVHNLLPYSLLREMVRDYLYMFPTGYKEKQRICQLVEIPMISQRLIDETSTQKKLLPP